LENTYLTIQDCVDAVLKTSISKHVASIWGQQFLFRRRSLNEILSIRQQRAEFAVRLSRGESMSALCREYAISRPTGYVWAARFVQHGVAGLDNHSRRPEQSPLQTPAGIEARIVELRRARPDWGARKFAFLLANEGHRMPVNQ
jgi:hypothetical protein